MSIVGKDLEVLDSFFNEQQEIGAKKERKTLMPIMAIMCVGSLLLGAKLVASPKAAPTPPYQVEIPTLPVAYDFTLPLPDISANPLELPPSFDRWAVVE